MNLLNDDFLNIYPNIFGTENVSLVIYSLIKSIRPKKLIEVGAGYTTFFILKSLVDIKKEIEKEIENRNITEYFEGEFHDYVSEWENYSPNFIVVEDFSHEETPKNLKSILDEKNVNKYCTFIESDLFDYIDKSQEHNYDFVWLDYGAGPTFFEVFQFFFENLNENGIIIFHSTESNLWGRYFTSQIKLLQKSRSDIEMITVLEPHKHFQNSFSIFRKTANNPIHSIDS
jgi:hypothetical protein